MTTLAPTAAAPRKLKIDFVSDVVCPWCVVGLGGLDQALAALKDEGVAADITFQPFELNPAIAPEGENIVEHIGRKYGSTPAQSAANRAMIRERAAEAWPHGADGQAFQMNMTDDSRIWNTFDAHRLLHWAHESGGGAAQHALKSALFEAHFTRNRDLTDPDVLADAAQAAGLDRAEAYAVATTDRHADAVRAEEDLWRSRGITSVPAIVVEGKYLISGGQPASVFEDALRKIAAEIEAAT